jgi:hypothetical protein
MLIDNVKEAKFGHSEIHLTCYEREDQAKRAAAFVIERE